MVTICSSYVCSIFFLRDLYIYQYLKFFLRRSWDRNPQNYEKIHALYLLNPTAGAVVFLLN